MAHARQEIRDNIIETLTGLTTTGSRVYASRVYPIAEGKLPGLLIYTESEEVETMTITPPRTQMRRLNVRLEAFVKGVSNFDDQIDTIAQEVEEALAVDVTRDGLADDTTVTGFEAEFSGDGDQPVAIGRMTIVVDYTTIETDVSGQRNLLTFKPLNSDSLITADSKTFKVLAA